MNLSKTLIINRSPLDLEFLISRWSNKSHMFIAAWGEFGPTLEDVVVLTGLPVFGDSKAMPGDSSAKMDEEGEIRLGLLNEALTTSNHKGKSAYNSWVSFFTDGPRVVSEVKLEAILSGCHGMFC